MSEGGGRKTGRSGRPPGDPPVLGEPFDALVARLVQECIEPARLGVPWRAALMDAVWPLIPALDPQRVLEAFRDSDEARFVLYDLQGRACRKPSELASLALCNLVVEVVESILEEEGRRSRGNGVS